MGAIRRNRTGKTHGRSDTAEGEGEKEMNHGGRREGAGRPTDYTLGERIAFAKMVIARQKKQPGISISKALQMLEDENQLIAGSAKALRRYLTPKYLPPNITTVRLIRE